MSVTVITYSCSLLLAPLLAAAQDAHRIIEQPTVYRLVFDAVCSALPEEPRDFILAHRGAIEDVVYGRPVTPSEGTAPVDGNANHFILLDIAAGDAEAARRIEAATQFPHSKKEAHKLFEDHDARGGELAWLIEDNFTKLLGALRKAESSMAERQIGAIIHLATDAALPFNTTTLAADELGATPTTNDEGAASATRRLRERFHGAFMERLKDRLAYEVRVSPARVRPISSPIDAAFDALTQSHRVSQELAAIDTEAIRRLGADDVTAFASSADLYSAALAERVAPLLENQIEAGALLAASLINTAWTTARPRFADVPGPASSTSAGGAGPTPVAGKDGAAPVEKPANGETAPASTLVASLGSTVYHRGDCSHVARIKAENRVEFKTKAEAEAAGRKPCRACKPEVESPPPKHEDSK